MPESSNALSARVTAVSRFYVGDITLEETLRRAARLANDTIAGADVVGVTLITHGRPRSTVLSGGTEFVMESAQYESGIGPGVDTLRSHNVHRVDSMVTDCRWPAFSQAAAAIGIMSSLSFPLIAHREGIGALDCFSYDRGAFSTDDEFIGTEFAAAAAIALANAQAFWEARHLNERLGFAMHSQATIEQAKGILIAERHCQPDQALAIMVRASQRENRGLGDIADRIVSDCWPGIESVHGHSTDTQLKRRVQPSKIPSTSCQEEHHGK